MPAKEFVPEETEEMKDAPSDLTENDPFDDSFDEEGEEQIPDGDYPAMFVGGGVFNKNDGATSWKLDVVITDPQWRNKTMAMFSPRTKPNGDKYDNQWVFDNIQTALGNKMVNGKWQGKWGNFKGNPIIVTVDSSYNGRPQVKNIKPPDARAKQLAEESGITF